VHRYGRAARDAVEAARLQVAALAGAQAAEVVWTSGGTESNNLALQGAAAAATASRILYGATEHPSVLETAEALRDRGWQVETIAVDGRGLVDWPLFEAQLARGPLCIAALMLANNETGVIQDVPRAGALVHAQDALLLADAVQAAGKLPLDFSASGADLMSLSSHKLYGPKGVGALLVRAGVELRPLLHGGGQGRSRSCRRATAICWNCASVWPPACMPCPGLRFSASARRAWAIPCSSVCRAGKAKPC
jgi:cysteine desulfurase